jgi:hypothetical protein
VVTVGDGSIIDIPLILRVLRVSNLQLPLSEKINAAMAEFYVEGDILNIEQFSVESKSVGIYGFGTALWPSMEIDLRYRSRSRARIPLVSTVFEGIRGEIVTGMIRGSISDPDVRLVPLEGASKLLGRLLGRDPTEQQKRLEQIEAMRATALEREKVFNEPVGEPQ